MQIQVRDIFALRIKRDCDKTIGTRQVICPTVRANELIAKGLAAEKKDGEIPLWA